MRTFLKVLLLVAMAYGVGFGAFVLSVPKPFEAVPEGVDGLAVFTGGAGRVEAALAAVEKGFGGPVYISGVHPDVKLRELAAPERFDAAQRKRLRLDYKALTTRQNVLNTAAWVNRRGLVRVGVVTSTYHALRSKVLFWWLAPDVKVVMLPVRPADDGWRTWFREYNKLVLAPWLN